MPISQNIASAIAMTALFAATTAVAAPVCDNFCHPIYAGFTGGYGSTTWEGLVPAENKRNLAMAMSTPIDVTEGGALWGLFAGVEITPYFALEAAYNRYPNAKVRFDQDSIFTFDNNGASYFTTHTETLSASGKIMLVIPRTRVRVYSSAGIAAIHRWDKISDRNRGTPTFGLGLNYTITDQIMTELGMSYTAGYGASELEPVNDYMPFLYSGFLRLAYRF